ncbi:MAG TPA: MFS transporter [Xanthomonadaceae bacterium]|nr:MFS transporter [Xanthomonadaceae bacterium]
MNHQAAPAATLAETAHKKSEIRKVAISSWIGTTIEFYDFLLYGTAAALVFGKLFFPQTSAIAGTLAAFATLAVGYVARPLGAAIFGHFGDKVGRKKMLMLTLVLMGTSSTAIGLLPTYQSVGILAPVLLVTCRLVQGIAIGGEWGGAALMVVEHAEVRNRAFWGSFAQIGAPTGVLLSAGILAIMSKLPPDQFEAWGWRVPFLFSVLLLVIGYVIRSSVSESPLFLEAQRKAAESRQQATRVPFVEVLRHPGPLLSAMGIGLGAFVIQAVMLLFGLSHAVSVGFERSQVLEVQTLGSALLIVMVIVMAVLADKLGRRPVVLGGALLSAAWAYPMLGLMNTGQMWALMLAVGVGTVAQAAMYAPLVAFLTEKFKLRTRYTGASLGYQGAALIGAGFTPLVATALKDYAGGGTGLVSALLLGCSLLCAGCVYFSRESQHNDLSQ